METIGEGGDASSCEVKLRSSPQRRRDRLRVGCGAGFSGDRPAAALRLLRLVEGLDYIVLECLAERTLADRYQDMAAGGQGYDPRISEWMLLLLPLAVEKGVRIITNMGAIDPLGAQRQVLHVANGLGLHITVGVAYETPRQESSLSDEGSAVIKGAISTYLGAAPIVECLEKYEPQVVITSRVADAALFLGPMVYELGWNWNQYKLLAQGTIAAHLLECGCQLTGGYFMHPGDKTRDFSFQQLLDLSLPYAEISFDGKAFVAKAEGSGGLLNFHTCAEQLLYEVGDPGSYITPDVVVDVQDVTFHSLSDDKVSFDGARPSRMVIPRPDKVLQLIPKVCGWKGWGEISYGGCECVKRAEAAKFLVLSWMEETYPGSSDCVVSYIIGHDSLKASDANEDISLLRNITDVRLHMDGLFGFKEHAENFLKEFTALYTNGPAGGGGISTGLKREIILVKELVDRQSVFWRIQAERTEATVPLKTTLNIQPNSHSLSGNRQLGITQSLSSRPSWSSARPRLQVGPAPSGKKIAFYEVAHSRAGDKGNDLNFSIIPHFSPDIARLKRVITPDWVLVVISPLLSLSFRSDPRLAYKHSCLIDQNVTVEIYEVRGIHSLNVVMRNVLDGGVNCSRRIDRHGKTISDLILSQKIELPSLLSNDLDH